MKHNFLVHSIYSYDAKLDDDPLARLLLGVLITEYGGFALYCDVASGPISFRQSRYKRLQYN